MAEGEAFRSIWCAVLLQAVRDAFLPRHDPRLWPDLGQAETALDWLLSEDCRTVVALAGYDEGVADRLVDMVGRHRAGETVLGQQKEGARRTRWKGRAA